MTGNEGIKPSDEEIDFELSKFKRAIQEVAEMAGLEVNEEIKLSDEEIKPSDLELPLLKFKRIMQEVIEMGGLEVNEE